MGTVNPGYVKWKPAHLNTVDFMMVPNVNLEPKYGKKIADLYTGSYNQEKEKYTRQFYSFMFITEKEFDKVNAILEANEERKFEEMMEAEQ